MCRNKMSLRQRQRDTQKQVISRQYVLNRDREIETLTKLGKERDGVERWLKQDVSKWYVLEREREREREKRKREREELAISRQYVLKRDRELDTHTGSDGV